MTEYKPRYDSSTHPPLPGAESSRFLLTNFSSRMNKDFATFTEDEKRRLERARAGALAGYYFDPSQDGFFTEPLPAEIPITAHSLKLRRSNIEHSAPIVRPIFEVASVPETQPITIFSESNHPDIHTLGEWVHHEIHVLGDRIHHLFTGQSETKRVA